MTDPRLRIDQNFLDQELVNQPSLVQEVGDEAAMAIAVRDTAEEYVKTVDAELDQEIRLEGVASKAKLTEASIAAAIQTHPRHLAAFTAYTEAKLAAAKAVTLEKAVATKSKALDKMSDLWMGAYWVKNSSKPSAIENAEYNTNRQKMADARRVKPQLRGD